MLEFLRKKEKEERLRGVLVNERFFERTPSGPEVVGSKCKKCGKMYFPQKSICEVCFEAGTLETHPLAKRGKIISFSISHQSTLGIPTPYAFAYLHLDDGIILYSILKDWEPAEEKLGVGVEVEQCLDVIRHDYNGNPIVGFKYRPVGR